MLCTRPDVSFALSVTSRFQRNPVEYHWTAVISILEYLGRNLGLWWNKCVRGYTGARFPKPTKIYLNRSMDRCFSWTVASWVGKSFQAERTIADSTTKGWSRRDAERKTNVWGVVGGHPVETRRHQTGLDPHWCSDSDICMHIYALRHDHLEMVISRYDKVADEDGVADPPMTMSYETPSTGLTWRVM